MGHGTIIAGSTLTMAATQKTFSIAVSRQMAPVARLVAYFVHDGEVVADAVSFHVQYSRLKVVSGAAVRRADQGWNTHKRGDGAKGSPVSCSFLRVDMKKQFFDQYPCKVSSFEKAEGRK